MNVKGIIQVRPIVLAKFAVCISQFKKAEFSTIILFRILFANIFLCFLD